MGIELKEAKFKVINILIEKCDDCPYFRSPGGDVLCDKTNQHYADREIKLILKGKFKFPYWCPLKNYMELI